MKKVFYLLVVIGMLLAMLPTAAVAVPPYQPNVSVAGWNLQDDMLAVVQFSAYDVNWKAWKPETLEFGFVYCDSSGCRETIDTRLTLNPQEYHYPQHLDIAAKTWRSVYTSQDCSITQFVRIIGNADNVLAKAENGPLTLCIGIPPQ